MRARETVAMLVVVVMNSCRVHLQQRSGATMTLTAETLVSRERLNTDYLIQISSFVHNTSSLAQSITLLGFFGSGMSALCELLPVMVATPSRAI